ncbi:MAG: sulfurtransferase TusA family protein [Hyphomicrobiaceae bacterium]
MIEKSMVSAGPPGKSGSSNSENTANAVPNSPKSLHANPMPARIVDARHLRCPLPVLKAKKALREISIGDVLEIVATDPQAETDLRALCAARSHEVVAVDQRPDEVAVLIRRLH